jgi:hypothetical protein
MNYMFNLEDYEPVEVRLEKFWKDNPDGRIYTELLESTATRFVVFSSIYRTEADAHPWATGLASETIADRGMLASSALEICETSSLGRALANAGYSAKVKGGNGKRPSREEMISATKAEMSKPKEFIPVVNEADPWTIKTVAAPTTSAEAVAVVKDIIGGTTDKDVPRCPHGEMHWAHGMTKANKPWGHFKCIAAATGEMNRCPKGEDVIWYEISPEGNWRPQKVRA